MVVEHEELEIERAFVWYVLPIIITLAVFFNLSAFNVTFKVSLRISEILHSKEINKRAHKSYNKFIT